MLTVIGLAEIEHVFEIIDGLGLSREAVVIPLKPAHPGGVTVRGDQRLQIVFDRERSLEDNLAAIRVAVTAILAAPEGSRLRRADG